MKKLSFLHDANGTESIEVASDYVDVRALAANVAKTFTKPLGSSKILFSTNFVAGDSITFGGDIASNVVTLTAVAAAPGANQFTPAGSLALTLAALVIQLQAAGKVPAGTYSVTDAGASITLTNTLSATPTPVSAIKSTGVATATQVIGARFVRLSAGALFYYRVDGVATVGASDVSNGAGSISTFASVQPRFAVDEITTISVIAPAIGPVSAEWWG